MKIWDKGYSLHRLVENYTVGNDHINDLRLVKYDCLASIAHARMLRKTGFLTAEESDALTNALEEIISLHEGGLFTVSKEEEDCHTAIENYLIKNLGDPGRKIHTGRSRNDQVLTALRLYYKDELNDCATLAERYVKSVRIFVKRYGKIQFPGYTHTRKAMPSTVKLWGGAFADSMKDTMKLGKTVFGVIDQSPHGAGAGFGVPTAIDRAFTAESMGFSSVQRNPVYTQLSRGKFEAMILHFLSQIMLDLNRLASDLIFFSAPETGYFEIPDELCTGSSIMPHKKNPDALEIMRGYYHVVVSYEFQVLSIPSNLVTGYNRDLQLTKEPLMNSFDITKESLEIAALLLDRVSVNREKCARAMTEELYAVEEAYRLVQEGVPFREAYRRVAKKYSGSQ
ncbi:argininosuccinate lyase [candidate division KSB1 bacterium]